MNFRLLPEWAQQDAVMLTWPHKDTDWADNLARVEPVYVELAKHITTQQQLVIVAHNSALKMHITALLNSASISLNRVHFVVTPTNDTWARDHGPLTCAAIDSPEQLKIYDFTFNGWGNKFESALDNQINRTLVKELSSKKNQYQALDMVLEGGGIEINEHGVLLTTSECLLNKNRNPDLNPADIEVLLKEHLGATSFLWVDHGYLAGDDTDSHIDTLVRFAPNNTLVYVKCDDETDEHYSALDAMEKQLKTFKTADNTPYNLIKLPWPKAAYDDEQTRLPATYANYLIINNAVLVPTYNDANDERALAQVQIAYPQHIIIGVNCQPIIEQFGSLHCITMQLPRGFLAGAAQ
ncbi:MULTISPECIES: agmatine deiminase family protein [unclassified Pseudoalteromonas]|uniref:agmatine deiminase family protein n=1 Tax=unclassified Pseudoalteromonas TaxID=194690 RepID=UPI0018CFB2D2|nr:MULTISPECIES: agmatine deiminase family protein [unclassified Pseudoalteromonas]MBH0038443.1 agmatine deiminase family protein [Pseudoalteromonas sp. SWN166]MBH0051211.1 agmatine deiminase family protein [Pseudoalteromonas sp. SWYJZ19]MBH0076204.1 agmatine deiminase family protein [Pseudoalteromonas sp. SWYJ118]